MKDLESLDAAFVIDTFLLLLIGIGPKIALVPFLEATAAARPATPAASSKPLATTSSSPSGRTPPEPAQPVTTP